MAPHRNTALTQQNPGDKTHYIQKAWEIIRRITGRREAGKLGDRTPLIPVQAQQNKGFQASPLLLLFSFSFILL